MITKVELKNVIPFAKGLIIDKLNKINFIYGQMLQGKPHYHIS